MSYTYNDPSVNYYDPVLGYQNQVSQQGGQDNVPGKDTPTPVAPWWDQGTHMGGSTPWGGNQADVPYYDPGQDVPPTTPVPGAPSNLDRSGPPPENPNPPRPPGKDNQPWPSPDDGRPGEPKDPPVITAPVKAPPNGDFKSWFMELTKGLPAGYDSLKKLESELAKYGVKLGGKNAKGNIDSIILPDGRIVDVGRSFASGDPNMMAWQWLEEANGGGGGPNPNLGPMVMPNGLVPPGLPYQPPQDMLNMQDRTLREILSTPTYSPEYQNQLNEQQKELILQRGAGRGRQLLQGAANRGVSRGGAAAADQRRASTDLSNQLLQSQRDVSLQTTGANRQGFLNALTSADSVFGQRFGRSMDWNKFLEAIREYGLDDAYRYAIANQNAEQNYLNLVNGQ